MELTIVGAKKSVGSWGDPQMFCTRLWRFFVALLKLYKACSCESPRTDWLTKGAIVVTISFELLKIELHVVVAFVRGGERSGCFRLFSPCYAQSFSLFCTHSLSFCGVSLAELVPLDWFSLVCSTWLRISSSKGILNKRGSSLALRES
jgi:hypothetical protein